MSFSPAGKKKLAAQIFLFLINIIVLALAARVNRFQDFFFVADLFPLGLSIATLVILVILLATDFSLENAYTGRPHVEIGIFGVLSIFWLSFGAFSTSRWRDVPLKCDTIPTDFMDERVWCKNLQALKAFVWLEFVICFIITVGTLRYAVTEHNRGRKHVWQMPLSRYRPQSKSDGISFIRDSEFLQYGGRFD